MSWVKFIAISVIISALIVCSVASLAYFFYGWSYTGRVYPGVHVLGLDLSGMTFSEAEATLRAAFPNYRGEALVLRYGSRQRRVTPGELGVAIDFGKTALEAYSVGRTGSLLEQLAAQASAFLYGIDLPPVVTFDRGKAAFYISRMAREVNHPVRNANAVLQDDLSVRLISAREGVEVDVEATLQRLEKQLSLMQGGEVELVVRRIPPVVSDAAPAKATMERLLSHSLLLTFRGHSWAVDRATIASWLVPVQLKDESGIVRLDMRLDDEAIRSFVEDIAAWIDRPPRDARFDFDPETGTLTPLILSQEGYRLKVEEAVGRIKAALESGETAVELPVEIIPPRVAVEDAEKLGIRELVSEATTSFKGSSAARVKNIQRAAAQFHGVVVPPGEIFSFNEYLGDVTAANGYEDSLIIWGDRTRVGIGGGVCQVSTTAFRAAFWGGYEIVERWAHGYRVSWYEPPVGLDATVFAPQVDFKFRNDTPYYLLIETEVDTRKGTVTFRFYSTRTGRTVEMEGPFIANRVQPGPPIYEKDPTLPKGVIKQVEWAKEGMDVTVKRIVKEGDRVIRKDTFVSRYRPWQAVYLVGTREG